MGNKAQIKFANLKMRVISSLILLAILITCICLGGWTFKILLLITWVLITGEIIYMLYQSNIGQNAKISLMLFLLASTSLLHLSWIRDHHLGLVSIFALLLIAFLTDVSAYFIGSIFRGPKVAPKISPGKHWSGTIGAIIITVFIIQLIYLSPIADIIRYISATNIMILSVLMQVGDLLESYCKRRYSVKDSSRLIPGHGGILDRFDSFLLAPIYYYYFVL